ncbi:peptidase E [Fulvitalea axinellae]|uniref:dipeptidase E n=1 Tax=Fulvitalea axinellae TaxID=1182444 RepID=A0AAU9D6J2_9BACT|nr:peptidase E [Fulvitalea axinellae]
MKKLLLLSNSTNPGEDYLDWPKDYLADFMSGEFKNIVFVPYAGITISYDEYTERLNGALGKIGLKATGIHEATDPVKAIQNADAIFVGGGNTFELLSQLYKNKLVEPIREKLNSGTPYVGWSAGSNMACPTVKTTNDMPITFPPSFDALSLIPFQINPHYTEATLPNHGGETRKMRLAEYLEINQDSTVVCLPEGTLLHVEGETMVYKGKKEGKVLTYGNEERILLDQDIV